MKLETKFDIGEQVWDLLTNKKVIIIGLQINVGRRCCNEEDNSTIYYVDNHLCGTFRKETELMRQ